MNALELPYEKLAAIKASIVRLDDLVAIFSQENGPGFLHVYNTKERITITDENVEVITLGELPERDLSNFNGLRVGFSCLDIILDNLLTKGNLFYPIERIFFERGQYQTLYRTMHRIAIFLVDHAAILEKQQPEEQYRIQAKIILLTLPELLIGQDNNNLVAILPFKDFRHFVKDGTAHFVYNDPAHPINLNAFRNMKVDTNREWVISLEELAIYQSGITPDGRCFLELRHSLHQSNRRTALQTTLHKLASDSYLQASEDDSFHAVAVTMMAEYWLAQEDVEDLVVFCPHNDFDRFAEHGDALRVYRTLTNDESPPSSPPGPRISLDKFFDGELFKEYSQTIISFQVILDQSPLPDSSHFLDLGGVIRKTGNLNVLARTLWLLSRDRFASSDFEEHCNYHTAKSVIDTAVRACFIYGLMNPWDCRQGRWGAYLQGSYQNLLHILGELTLRTNDFQSSYYKTLYIWYGCGLDATHTDSDMKEMFEHLREFLRIAQENPALVAEEQQMEVDILHQISDIIPNLKIESKGFEKTISDIIPKSLETMDNVTGILYQTARAAAVLSTPSILFLLSLQTLFNERKKRQQFISQEWDVDRLIGKLHQFRADLQRKQQMLFAPPHEREILEFAYREEVNYLEELLQDLETSAKLTISLKNPRVDLNEDVELSLEITNIGPVEAQYLEIYLAPPKGFQLLEERPIHKIDTLAPGTSTPFKYNIRPESLDAELRLDYRFSDRRGELHNASWVNRLTVRNLDENPFKVKINHYQFGRPIQKPREFYGRRTELQNILSHLVAGTKQSLLLRGPRRMGKTSLLYVLQHVLRHREDRKLFDIPADWDAELGRLHPVFLSLHAFASVVGKIREIQLFSLLIERVTDVFDDEQAIKYVTAFQQRATEVGPVNAALEQVKIILDAHPGEQIIVLLDEYDEVYRRGSGQMDQSLREFVSAEQRLTWIIASTLGLFEAVKSVSSPWFNIFPIIELERLSRSAGIDLVEIPSQTEEVVWYSDAVLVLLDETGNHPAFTQLFCSKVIEYLNQKKSTNYVERDTITTVANQIVSEQATAHSHFEFYWSDMPGIGQLILLIMDSQEELLTRGEIRRQVIAKLEKEFGDLPRRRVRDEFDDLIEWWEKEFKKGIDWADKITDAIDLNAQRKYIFSVPLFRRWLGRQQKFEDLMPEALNKISKEMERDGLVDV